MSYLTLASKKFNSYTHTEKPIFQTENISCPYLKETTFGTKKCLCLSEKNSYGRIAISYPRWI